MLIIYFPCFAKVIYFAYASSISSSVLHVPVEGQSSSSVLHVFRINLLSVLHMPFVLSSFFTNCPRPKSANFCTVFFPHKLSRKKHYFVESFKNILLELWNIQIGGTPLPFQGPIEAANRTNLLDKCICLVKIEWGTRNNNVNEM